jgi:hypothetical protein
MFCWPSRLLAEQVVGCQFDQVASIPLPRLPGSKQSGAPLCNVAFRCIRKVIPFPFPLALHLEDERFPKPLHHVGITIQHFVDKASQYIASTARP